MKIPEQTINAFGVLGFPTRHQPGTFNTRGYSDTDVNTLYPEQIRFVEDFQICGVSVMYEVDLEKELREATTNDGATGS
jgi:hypothetical protein